MIERHWKGITKQKDAGLYIEHLLNDTFPAIEMIAGFKKASILKRNVFEGTEFLIITVWDSMDAIRQFAGINTDVAVVPLAVREIMITYDEHVIHYEVAY